MMCRRSCVKKFENAKDIVIAMRPVEYKGRKLGTSIVGITMEPVLAAVYSK